MGSWVMGKERSDAGLNVDNKVTFASKIRGKYKILRTVGSSNTSKVNATVRACFLGYLKQFIFKSDVYVQ
jgi:hypothetical protein